ncbi:MAG: SpoIID/LytB domain-containing protein [Planctomycetota bacterium]
MAVRMRESKSWPWLARRRRALAWLFLVLAALAITGLLVKGPLSVSAASLPEVLVIVAGPAASIPFTVTSPFALVPSEEAMPALRIDFPNSGTVVARTDGGRLQVGDRRFAGPDVVVHSTEPNSVSVGDLPLSGRLVLRLVSPEALVALDRVDIETYVEGVLLSEMPGWFETEALKAQAVAIRSYAWHQATVLQRPLYADDRSQVYRGRTNAKRARAYVGATRGQVLVWDGAPLRAYYHSTCGGATAPASVVFGDSDIPPLAGGPCSSCQESPRYRWFAEVPQALLAERLLGGSLERILGVELERDEAASTRAVCLTTPSGTQRVAWRDFQRACAGGAIAPLFSSYLLTVEPKAGALVFHGAGWGHRVGLCQYGANGLAQRGLGYLEILGWYYPKARVEVRWH